MEFLEFKLNFWNFCGIFGIKMEFLELKWNFWNLVEFLEFSEIIGI